METTKTEPPYFHQFRNIAFERRDSILQIRMHTDGGSMRWGAIHGQLGDAFREAGKDLDNLVVILTGTGDDFCMDRNLPEYANMGPADWPRLMREARDILLCLLEIDVPVIAAVNGPAHIHPELAVLADIVIASETASFRDSHMPGGIVPGDGCHVVWKNLLGHSRGNYFLLMEEVLSVEEAKQRGIVHEILPHGAVLARAWEIAKHLRTKPPLTLRYSRMLFVQPLREIMTKELALGLAFEGFAQRG